MTPEAASQAPRTYGVAVTRQTRTTSHVLHIAETVRGLRWTQTRTGRALCWVPVAIHPEPGTPEDATCRKCIRKYQALTESDR